MKLNKLYAGLTLLAGILASSCENQNNSFPDFDYQTVYFANSYYVRTVELGEDLYVDLTSDNEHKINIMATMGGVYKNKKNRIIHFKVDPTLCDNLYFTEGEPVVPMPSSYYQLASDQIVIPSGKVLGGVEVQLKDAFFEDPQSLVNTYVIPLLMTSVEGADSILQGKPKVTGPDRCVADDWDVAPQDFVLCAVKYVNPWHGNYLRRGIDMITGENATTQNVRHAEYVENDEEVNIITNSLTKATLPLTTRDQVGKEVRFEALLSFANDGTCTVSGSTASYEIEGKGHFVSKGEKNSMGGKDRDVLYLDYTVLFNDLNLHYATKDTLVVRDRGVKPEYFSVVKQ